MYRYNMFMNGDNLIICNVVWWIGYIRIIFEMFEYILFMIIFENIYFFSFFMIFYDFLYCKNG